MTQQEFSSEKKTYHNTINRCLPLDLEKVCMTMSNSSSSSMCSEGRGWKVPQVSAQTSLYDEWKIGSSLVPAGLAECEVVFEGHPSLESLFDKCQKNSGHSTFIPILDLTTEDLPRCMQNVKALSTIKHMAKRTVRVVLVGTSERPLVYPGTSLEYPYSHDKYKDSIIYGTGYIDEIRIDEPVQKQCQCSPCRKSLQPKMEYFEIKVTTAAHVIYDDKEALNSMFECFYDSEDRKGVKFLHGIGAVSDAASDTCTVTCTTHDKELLAILPDLRPNIQEEHVLRQSEWDALIISHPHGRLKHISMGKASSAYKFQPGVEWTSQVGSTYRVPRTTDFNLSDLPGEEDRCRYDEDFIRYELPEGTEWIFPSHFDPDCQFEFWQLDTWIKLPHGTQVKLPSKNVVSIPPDASAILFGEDYRLVYNVDTCPGSSGGPILIGSDENAAVFVAFSTFCHFGNFKGSNRSSFLQPVRRGYKEMFVYDNSFSPLSYPY